MLDGLELQNWDVEALRQRIGVIFQDFGRYQFSVGEYPEKVEDMVKKWEQYKEDNTVLDISLDLSRGFE